MLEIDFQDGKWSPPVLKPYGPLVLDPSCSVFHYGLECFEGMKAYKDSSNQCRLFRPEMNMSRFLKSAQRLSLPSFDPEELLKCIKELVKLDSDWIPKEKGYSLYIRPTLISTEPTLGVASPTKAKIFVICSPVGPYYKTGFNAVNLKADTNYVRAWPGGTGEFKVGGNYAPGILPQKICAHEGYQQNLWLFGVDDLITEVGTMNCFIYWKNANNENELVTPELGSQLILPGVTRASIIELASKWNEFKVTEKKIPFSEFANALKEKRVYEMFGSGTAAIVSPIKNINVRGKDYPVPLDPSNPNAQAGPLAKRLYQAIQEIQYGDVEHEWSIKL